MKNDDRLTVGSLFSGIGGLELGLERTGGFKTIWNSEIDEYASAVLKKHWPGVPNLGDITKIDWAKTERPDLVCGGFPCQDISTAGKGAGIKEGTRSGLWFEFHKALHILRPRYALVENVSALSFRGLCVVLGDLAQIGYDAEWFTIRASDVGAPHRRERLFIVANAYHARSGTPKVGLDENRSSNFKEQEIKPFSKSCGFSEDNSCSEIPDASSKRPFHEADEQEMEGFRARELLSGKPRSAQRNSEVSDSERGRPSQSWQLEQSVYSKANEAWKTNRSVDGGWWATEPDVGRVAHGVSNRVERLKCLGNAVVPQVAQVIGEAILETERQT